MAADTRQDVQPLDVILKKQVCELGQIAPMGLTFCARVAALEVDDIIHVLEHQQDDDYIDERNNDLDLTDLVQDE